MTPTQERLLLLVEDDAAFARTLRRSFERRGYRVLHAIVKLLPHRLALGMMARNSRKVRPL